MHKECVESNCKVDDIVGVYLNPASEKRQLIAIGKVIKSVVGQFFDPSYKTKVNKNHVALEIKPEQVFMKSAISPLQMKKSSGEKENICFGSFSSTFQILTYKYIVRDIDANLKNLTVLPSVEPLRSNNTFSYNDIIASAIDSESKFKSLSSDELNSLKESYQGLISSMPPKMAKVLSSVTPTNVKGDIFHLIKRIMSTCKQSHGAFASASSKLMSTLFRPIQSDIDIVDSFLSSKGKDADTINNLKTYKFKKVYLRHCRRITATSRLHQYKCLHEWTELFKSKLDATTREELLRPSTLLVIEKAKLDILHGFYIDASNVNLFTHVRDDKNGLPIWKTSRGTNALEGFHRHIRDLLRRHRTSRNRKIPWIGCSSKKI